MFLRPVYLLCLVAIVSADQQCKFLQNYVFYNITGESNLKGISPANVNLCITRAMSVLENTISGLRLLDTKNNPEEEAKIAINFQKLIVDDVGTVPSPSETAVNCAISRACPAFAVQSARIYFNSNLNFVCKQHPEENSGEGIDLYQTALYELLHAFGLQSNDDATSIMYRHRDNFAYQDNGELNKADRDRVGQIYFLREAKN